MPAGAEPGSDGALGDLDVVVLCGGRGTRLGALTAETPKPLLPVAGEPFLGRLIDRWRSHGLRRFTLAAGYRAEQMRAFAEACGGDVRVIVEPAPLGTGGALRHAAERVRSSTLLVVNGDSWVEQPPAPVVAWHRAGGWAMTLVGVAAERVIGGAADKARCVVDRDGRVRGFSTERRVESGWINGGVYVLERAAALRWPDGAYSLEQHLLSVLGPDRAGLFPSDVELLDIGTPACYAAAERLLVPAAAERPATPVTS